MLRSLVAVACLLLAGLVLGCGGGEDRANNPNNLEYSKEGPPPREGPGAPNTGGGERPNRGGRVPGQPK